MGGSQFLAAQRQGRPGGPTELSPGREPGVLVRLFIELPKGAKEILSPLPYSFPGVLHWLTRSLPFRSARQPVNNAAAMRFSTSSWLPIFCPLPYFGFGPGTGLISFPQPTPGSRPGLISAAPPALNFRRTSSLVVCHRQETEMRRVRISLAASTTANGTARPSCTAEQACGRVGTGSQAGGSSRAARTRPAQQRAAECPARSTASPPAGRGWNGRSATLLFRQRCGCINELQRDTMTSASKCASGGTAPAVLANCSR
jgi:hypothetical protein